LWSSIWAAAGRRNSPRTSKSRGEAARVGDRVRSLILDVRRRKPRDPQIFLSAPHFLISCGICVAQEVPEIYDGIIENQGRSSRPWLPVPRSA